ncbi:hypothetical protein H9P43_001961 [Blastocladiella emersonii ATCC 22665]|nr:hypothetical protein H9P43_001961 [Blastocladiella emersonii ATCC 22665]
MAQSGVPVDQLHQALAAAIPLTIEEREQRLRTLFESFATFGASRSSQSTLLQQHEPLIDSARFLKFFKDLTLLDGALTSTSLDLHFTKARAHFKRTDRKLDYEAFLYALQLAAVTKFGAAMADDDALECLISEACRSTAGGPIARATVPVTDGVYSKLTEGGNGAHQQQQAANYTVVESGMAKMRLGGGGNGSRSGSSSNLVAMSGTGNRSRSNLGPTASGAGASGGGSRSNLAYRATASSTARTASSHALTAGGSGSRGASMHSLTGGGGNGGSRTNLSPKRTTAAAGGSTSNLGTAEFAPTQPEIPRGSVFDRLTNPKGYTGTHKERFDEEGKGRGLAGRVQDDIGAKSLDQLVERR